MNASQAERLSNFGKLLMLGGAVWGVSRAAPSLRKPALCFGAGAVCWYMARQARSQTSLSVSSSGRIGGDSWAERDVIDITPSRVTAPA